VPSLKTGKSPCLQGVSKKSPFPDYAFLHQGTGHMEEKGADIQGF
jgi:hypothetical protein